MPKNTKKKGSVLPKKYPYVCHDEDFNMVKDMIDFYTDVLANYPEQARMIIRKTCVLSLKSAAELKTIITDTFNGVACTPETRAALLGDLKELNYYANQTAATLKLAHKYNQAEIVKMVQDAAIYSAFEKKVVVREVIKEKIVTIEKPLTFLGFFSRVFGKKPADNNAPANLKPFKNL